MLALGIHIVKFPLMRNLTENGLQKGTLARPVRADYGRQLATMDVDVYFVKDGQPANLDRKIFDSGAA